MAIFPKRTDYVTDALAAMTDQFKKNVMQKIMTALADEGQQLEDVIFQLLDGRGVDTAVGAQLDGLGDIVGVPRSGRTDEVYRIRIRAQILLNLTNGTPEEILALVRQVTGGTATIQEYYPASFVVTTPVALTTAQAAEVVAIVKAATPAGVRGQYVYSNVAEGNTFRFSATSTTESDASKGFSDLSQVTGGKLSGVAN